MRPGPEPALRDLEAAPRAGDEVAPSAARTSSKTISPWPCGSSRWPNTGTMRTIFTPGVSIGTITIEWRWWRSACGSVTPMKMRNLQRGSPAPLVHHFWPLMTISSPSTSQVAFMLVASLDATAGSVMAKPERISPSSSGASQRSFCSSRAVAHQHLGVAGVGRAAVEDLGREEAAAHDLGQRRVVAVVEAGAVLAVGQEEVPQPGGLRLGLQLLDDRRDAPLPPVVGARELLEVRRLVRQRRARARSARPGRCTAGRARNARSP